MGNKITTREGFISDNLVNIGRRLQINHDLQNPEEVPDTAAPVPQEKLSVRRLTAERTEAERMSRELMDRIGHESAAVGAELEQMETRRAELEHFRKFLDDAAAEAGRVDVSSVDAVRRLGDIRYRFFSASGRARTFLISREPAPGAAPKNDFEYRPSGVVWRESLPLIAALLVAALLVGAAVIYSLR